MDMNRLLRVLMAVLGLTSASLADAQTNEKAEVRFVIEGHFFVEKPMALPEGASMQILKTASGNSVIGVMLPEGSELPEAALQYAVPMEQVPDGERLLAQYEHAKKQGGLWIGQPRAPKDSVICVGKPLPEFSAVDLEGRTWTRADVQGKVMVLNLWYTGCGPCRAEMPELSTWKDEMPDVMFFSATYEDERKARPVIEGKRFNWIPLVDDTQFYRHIGSKGYPMFVVVDKEGFIVMVENGTSPLQRKSLKEKIQSLR